MATPDVAVKLMSPAGAMKLTPAAPVNCAVPADVLKLNA